MTPSPHELASHHLPPFITAPGESDWLLTLMGIVLVGSVLGAGVFFFWLHSLPERMVHNKVQFDHRRRSRTAVAVYAHPRLLGRGPHYCAHRISKFFATRDLKFAEANCRIARDDVWCEAEAGEAKPLPPAGPQSDRREASCHPAPPKPARQELGEARP